MTHSPLPWRVENTKMCGPVVFDACGDRVHVAGNALAGDNMKLAVRAVNAHAELVRVLEEILADPYCKPVLGSLRIRADRALKLARGEV